MGNMLGQPVLMDRNSTSSTSVIVKSEKQKIRSISRLRIQTKVPVSHRIFVLCTKG